MAIYQYCQGKKITSICKVEDGEFAPLKGRVSRKCEAAKGGVGLALYWSTGKYIDINQRPKADDSKFTLVYSKNTMKTFVIKIT